MSVNLKFPNICFPQYVKRLSLGEVHEMSLRRDVTVFCDGKFVAGRNRGIDGQKRPVTRKES